MKVLTPSEKELIHTAWYKNHRDLPFEQYYNDTLSKDADLIKIVDNMAPQDWGEINAMINQAFFPSTKRYLAKTRNFLYRKEEGRNV